MASSNRASASGVGGVWRLGEGFFKVLRRKRRSKILRRRQYCDIARRGGAPDLAPRATKSSEAGLGAVLRPSLCST